MRKKTMFALAVIATMGLAGCSGNQKSGANQQYSDQAQPMGYYSNENHPQKRGGYLNDNDGPLVEMMDHTLGAESDLGKKQQSQQLQNRDIHGNPVNPTVPLAKKDENFFYHDNNFNPSNTRLRGNSKQSIEPMGESKDEKSHNRVAGLIREQVQKMDNVKKIRSIVVGSTVLISVDLKDASKDKQTGEEIRKAAEPFASGRSIIVKTNEGDFSRD